MAKVFIVTEQDFKTLIASLELTYLRHNNFILDDPNRPPTTEDIWRAFNMVAVRWVQKQGSNYPHE
jgi:hypothetical protein